VTVGRIGDSYDNALAETINGLYKAEVIHSPQTLGAPVGKAPGETPTVLARTRFAAFSVDLAAH
jgi:transposase InsO family protein